MKLFKIVVFAALAMVSSVSVQAAVVLSNMGANGLTDTSGFSSSTVSASNLYASGFTTGSFAQQLDWVSLVVDNAGTRTVGLYSDVSGSPGSLLYTSTGTTVGATKDVRTFNFLQQTLQANTTYWVRPQIGLTWYIEANNADPTAQNSSGFIYAGSDKRSQDGGTTWTNRIANYTISVSTSDVVPEPALTSLLCFGGIALIRRRMKK